MRTESRPESREVYHLRNRQKGSGRGIHNANMEVDFHLGCPETVVLRMADINEVYDCNNQFEKA